MTHNTKISNQRSDSHIATPISEEGLPGYEGSGSVGGLDEARVSFGLAYRYVYLRPCTDICICQVCRLSDV